MKIGIVAGETSGDILGGRLMAAIRDRAGDVEFVGVGGESMLAQGLQALAPLEALAVNGFKDPLLRSPSLFRLLRRLRRRFLAEPMDVVVGVDFNVFNFMLERAVKKRGMPTAHYVSPSVYAWRPGRIKRIAKTADAVLALYPFEPSLYQDHGGRAVFVGHPLADEVAPDAGSVDARRRAREALGVAPDGFVVALLPGSRSSEIAYHGAVFLRTAACLRETFPDAEFVIPAPTPTVHDAMRRVLAEVPVGGVRLVHGQSRTVIAAADLVLVKSGTATLEAMLLRRPMVVTYRMGRLSAWVIRRLKTSPYVALPNILTGRELVPELLQEQAQPARLTHALIEQYRRCQDDPAYLDTCAHWHKKLRQGGAGKAAEVVLSLAGRGTSG
ncbi:MAG: lipid-A-disaccharide synthase [Gammaproteobacteria bacterium]|nr:lipid-A-disaccharide synthase [Gammaproteobacteria bacterium]